MPKIEITKSIKDLQKLINDANLALNPKKGNANVDGAKAAIGQAVEAAEKLKEDYKKRKESTKAKIAKLKQGVTTVMEVIQPNVSKPPPPPPPPPMLVKLKKDLEETENMLTAIEGKLKPTKGKEPPPSLDRGALFDDIKNFRGNLKKVSDNLNTAPSNKKDDTSIMGLLQQAMLARRPGIEGTIDEVKGGVNDFEQDWDEENE